MCGYIYSYEELGMHNSNFVTSYNQVVHYMEDICVDELSKIVHIVGDSLSFGNLCPS